MLSQSLSHDNESQSSSVVSSILITLSGQPIASHHLRRPPPPLRLTIPKTPAFGDHDAIPGLPDQSDEVENPVIPFHVSRSGKTRVYSLFASTAWKEYQRAGMGKQIFTQQNNRSESYRSSRNSKHGSRVPGNNSSGGSGGSGSGAKSSKHSKKSKASNTEELRKPSGSSAMEPQSPPNNRDWISFMTDDSSASGVVIFIMSINLKTSGGQLLLVLVADGDCALGTITKKAEETATVLEEGLDTYKISS